ncbi:MAG: preprotein translocase subunit SecG [Ruminococcaceae bacterium]|nr:preprotein translocase subunit SecG [Oscillospiraceae bacterium]
MGIWEILISIVLIIASIIIIAVILLQQGRQANIGAISGAADTFMDKGRAKTWDQFLAKFTKYIAIAFFVIVLVGMIVTNLLTGGAAG